MTGEIAAIGGLKKVLYYNEHQNSHSPEIKRIVEIPLNASVEFITVEHMDEILKYALHEAPQEDPADS